MAFMILYRFRPFNQHTITELLTEKLHFSHPKTWNDPFEYDTRPNIGSRFACFAQNKNEEEQDALYNLLMWSHYDDSHKGICIEYEDKSWAINEGYSGMKIMYKEQVGVSDRGSIMVFYKHKCWEYENEYRMIVGNYREDLNFQGVDMPYSEIELKIKGIYCGVEFEKNQIETLKIIHGERDFEISTGEVQNHNSIKFTKLVRLKGLEPSHPKY